VSKQVSTGSGSDRVSPGPHPPATAGGTDLTLLDLAPLITPDLGVPLI